MEFSFTGISKVVFDHQKGSPSSKHKETNIRLEISNNLDRSKYLHRGLPIDQGYKTLSICFIMGLVANIHKAHADGVWDSAEHLRYIIAELVKGFSEVAEISEGEM